MKKIRTLFIAVFFVFLGASLAWAPCGISGYLYCDVDQDGIFSNDDIPLPGVDIQLDGVSVATTDENGMYTINSSDLCNGELLSLDESTLPEEYTDYSFVNPPNNDGVTYEQVRTDQEPPLPLPQQDFGVYDDACVTRDIVAVKECVASGTTSDDYAEFKITITNKGDTDFTCEGPEIGTPISVPADDPIQTKEGIMVSPADDVCLEQDPKVINTTTVICNDGLGTAFELPVSANCPVPCDACIDVVKVCAETETIMSGDDVDFNIVIKNCGDTTLELITIDDPAVGPILPIQDLAPGAETEIAVFIPAAVCVDAEEGDDISTDYKVSNAVTVSALDGTLTAMDDAICPCGVPDYEGCTPGYWKNSPFCWCGDYTPTTTLGSVFSGKLLVEEDSLMTALNYGGGGGLEGQARNMLRQCVAALLNACSADVNAEGTVDGIKTMVNAALDSDNKNEIEATKENCAGWNEDNPCPINSENAREPCSSKPGEPEECVPEITECSDEAQCGVELDDCGDPIDCGICDIGLECIDNMCVTDKDNDGDGVTNENDECEDTPTGEIVDPSNGCSIEQLVPSDGDWKNHRKYVKASAKVLKKFKKKGLITKSEKKVLKNEKKRSDCGK